MIALVFGIITGSKIKILNISMKSVIKDLQIFISTGSIRLKRSWLKRGNDCMPKKEVVRSQCNDPRLSELWDAYSSTHKALFVNAVVSSSNWNDTASYLAIAEQLTAMAWRLA